MTTNGLNRRGFLKLLPLLLALQAGLPVYRSLGLEKKQGNPGVNLPNILLLVFDTFSARHASFFGYQRETTPNLSEFAKQATVFHRHYAGGNFTVPGTASLLTGVYPWTHRGMHIFGTVKKDFVDRNIFSALPRDYFKSTYTHNALVMNLLEQFKSHVDQLTPMRDLALRSESLSDLLFPNDYTASFWGERIIRGSGFDMPSSLFLSIANFVKDFHFNPPKDLVSTYAKLYPLGLPTHTIGFFFLLEEAIDWILQQVTSLPQPFFGYYHLLPPHEPYRARKEFLDRFDDGWQPPSKPSLRYSQGIPEAELNKRRRQYDQYIAYVDAEFGRLYNQLEQTGVLQNTCVVVTSDHGQLFERGIHGHLTPTLYEPVIRIPLLIAKPGQKEAVHIYSPTSCIDVLPTLLDLCGQPTPDWCEGKPLPTIGQTSTNSERKIFVVEAKSNPKAGPLSKGTVALIKEPYKLVYYFNLDKKREIYELYDIQNDPDEMEDLSAIKKGMTAELKAELAGKLAEQNRVP